MKTKTPFIFKSIIDSNVEVVIMAYYEFEAINKLSDVVKNYKQFKLI